ncbi:MAG: TolC family outer membrane protein [gamma proteobacterium symbiont of Lucinoma myriamae]|nr:TolC family outer membrane protein [gamma proteobacterium symbiont of Lucinoma myriamae]MCU7818696.1 TolC family outer membrane protein [gamma proteobacterium symbiont of Lucinoma myriamae]MCU7831807.1 TolC family outer membrane protein [gamma proteobacterium symbiont of Lucinoma myriamae]
MNLNKNKFAQSKLSASVISSCLLAALSFTPVVQAEDLLEVYSLAYQTDPVLKQIISQRQSVGEGSVQAFARFLPFVNASAETSANRTNPSGNTVDNSSKSFNRHGYNLNLNQSIFDNTNYVNYRIANLQISKAEANLSAAQQELIFRSADAYFRTLAAIDSVGFSKAERKAISRQLDQAKRRYEVGIIAITEVHEAQAGYDNANAQVIAAENDLLISKEVLRELTSQYIDNISALAETIPLLPPTPEKITHWVDQALSGNYTLLAAKEDTFVQKENINLQRSGHYPTLGLTASYGYSKDNLSRFETSSQSKDSSIGVNISIIGVNISIPIYEGNSVVSKTRQAQYDFQQSQEAYTEVLNSTEKNARSSYLNVISEVSRVKALKQAVISNESALKATEAGFEVGTRTIVDVLNVQRDLYRAKQEHSNSRYIYILNVLKLKQASGELARVDIETVNNWLVQ